MRPAQQPAAILAGDTATMRFEVPGNVSGHGLRWSLGTHPHADTAEILLSKTTGDGIVTAVAEDQTIVTVRIAAGETAPLQQGSYHHELKAWAPDGTVTTLVVGPVGVTETMIAPQHAVPPPTSGGSPFGILLTLTKAA